MKKQIIALTALLSLATSAFATAELRLSDGTTTITVVDGDGNDQSPDPGVVYFNGPVGPNWTVNITIGVSKPEEGSPGEPYMDLDTTSLSTKAGDLKIDYTDTDFTAASGTFDAVAGGTTDGSVEFKYYLDGSNTPFGTNVTVADFPNQVDVYAAASNGTFSITAPYSMTVEALIHHNGKGSTGFDSSIQLTPPQYQPPTIQCAGDIDLGCNPPTITGCDTNSVTIITAPCGVSNITCAAAGPDTITGCVHERDLVYTVTDNCGQSTTCTQHIFWTVDHNAPTFDNCPSDIELGCNPATIPDCDLSITATDDCSKAVVTCSPSDTTDGCHHTRTLTYVASDKCGNKTTCIQHITWNTCTGTIGDFVWYDANGNGCQDAGEPGIPGVKVDLYSGCGTNATLITSTTTDTNGLYMFTGLCLGDYTIGFNTPTGYTRTTPHAGCANNALPPDRNQTDSKCDCAPGTPCGVCVTLTEANPINLNVDCGYVCNGQIGDFVWYDANGNGCQDAGEPGITGVKVNLYSGCGSNTTFITSTLTDTNGHYLFNNLCAGDYTVSFNTPAGYGHTIAHAGCANNANPPYSNQTDSKCDCAPSAVCGVCVTLTPTDNINLNVDCGYTCVGEIGDFVWYDANGNGCQDAGEPGIPGVTVDLYSGCGVNAVFVKSTTTDGNGHYLFSGLCAGDYSIKFHTPAGYAHTLALQSCNIGGQPSTDTDSNCQCTGTDDCSVCVTLTPLKFIDHSIDCGYVCNGQIGDFVWNDSNGNGCQDAGEPGIPNVEVDLYSGCGANTTLIATTMTDTNGHYLFTGLCAGDYTVSFVTPAGYARTTANAGCVDNSQPPYSNQRDSKCSCASGTPCGVCVTLTSANPIDLNVDCGYVCNGVIGDFVWDDLNGNGCQDSGEPGIPNVKVDLYSGCGSQTNFVTSTVTDSTGHYAFSNLCLGDYTVSFNIPAGYVRTIAHAGCTVNGNPPYSNQTDSKCDCISGEACGICVPLTAANPINLNIDCGYTQMRPGLELTKTVSTNVFQLGQPITYCYTVTNTGGLAISNINIVDNNGTPADTTDDFTVNPAPFTLQPGQSTSYCISHITEPLCITTGTSNTFAGWFTINVLGNGDVEATWVQDQGINDNRYGTGATAATGWSKGHKFSDLTGSDEAEFQFFDSKGNVVLDFQEDYISQATSAKFGDGVTITYPSGYGTLGPLGGDGKIITGASSNVLTCRTSFSDTINQPQFISGYTVNSPPETSPLSNVSTPAGWNYTNSYYVKVSHNAFGANGFGHAGIAAYHDSPAKISGGKYIPTNICNCVSNYAVATGTAIVGGSTVTVSDSASAVTCPPNLSTNGGGGITNSGTCNITRTGIAYGKPPGVANFPPPAPPLDPHKIQVAIQNNGSSAIVISELDLNWPSATNGKLQNATVNGSPAFWNGPPANPPVALTTFVGAAANRTIAAGKTGYLVLQFEKNVSTTASQYSGTVKFGSDASCSLTILP